MAAGAAVKGVGGKKGRSGRKSKAEELGVIALLDKCWKPADRAQVIKNLVIIACNGDPKAAVSAANLLMAYAYGKPTEKHELSGKDGGPIQHSATVIIIPDNGRDKN